ncbi:MAG: GyrI-like domain-containing protein [Chloroflexi bacterium]|nr:GyrI-like domain-containing protein [Chloroflexota bacterium]
MIISERHKIMEPKLAHRDEQPYVAIRSQVTMPELGTVLPPLIEEVFGWLASKGVEPAGAPFWRYLVIDMEAKLEIDVAVPMATAVTGEGRIIADVLPAGRYAVLVHTGPYEGLFDATVALLAWAQEKGLVSGISGRQALAAKAGGRVSRPTSRTQLRSRIQRNGRQSWRLS